MRRTLYHWKTVEELDPEEKDPAMNVTPPLDEKGFRIPVLGRTVYTGDMYT